MSDFVSEKTPLTSASAISKIMEASRIFARDYKTYSRFEGFSEEEIAKGATISRVLLDAIIENREAGNGPLSDDELEAISEVIAVSDEEWKHVYAVFHVIADIIGSNVKQKDAPTVAAIETSREPKPIQTSSIYTSGAGLSNMED